MKINNKIFCVLFILLFIGDNNLFAIKHVNNVINERRVNIWNFGVQYAPSIPLKDLAKTVSFYNTIGGFVALKTENDMFFSIEYNYLFGGRLVKKGHLDSISTKSTTEPFIINARGEYQLMEVNHRGHLPLLKVGKVFSDIGPNQNSGIVASLGGGYLIHYLYYYWTGDAPPQLSGDYLKGYDRRTQGLALSQSISYLHYSKNKMVNYMVSIEALQGFTYNIRSYNFDLQKVDDKRRMDASIGLKFSWMIPYYKKDGFDNEFH